MFKVTIILKNGIKQEVTVEDFNMKRTAEHVTEMDWKHAEGHPKLFFVNLEAIEMVLCEKI